MRQNEKKDQWQQFVDRENRVLGVERCELLQTQPRRSAYFKTMEDLFKTVDHDYDAISDDEILGAFDIAIMIWPVEAEICKKLFTNIDKKRER